MEVEILVAEVGAEPADDQLFHILYDGTVVDETRLHACSAARPRPSPSACAQALGARQSDVRRGADRRRSRPSPGPTARSAPTTSRSPCSTGRNGRRAFRRLTDDEVAASSARERRCRAPTTGPGSRRPTPGDGERRRTDEADRAAEDRRRRAPRADRRRTLGAPCQVSTGETADERSASAASASRAPPSTIGRAGPRSTSATAADAGPAACRRPAAGGSRRPRGHVESTWRARRRPPARRRLAGVARSSLGYQHDATRPDGRDG